MKLEGRVALVAGGGMGIWRAMESPGAGGGPAPNCYWPSDIRGKNSSWTFAASLTRIWRVISGPGGVSAQRPQPERIRSRETVRLSGGRGLDSLRGIVHIWKGLGRRMS